MEQAPQVAVIGGGSWGTALIKVLSENLPQIYWYMRDYKNLRHIAEYHHNPSYLSSVVLDTAKIHLTNDLNEATEKAQVLFFAIPSVYLKLALEGVRNNLRSKTIVSGIKGLIPNDQYTISEFFHHYLGVPSAQIAIISGPTHSEEVAMEKLSYVAVASENKATAKEIGQMIETRYLKPKVARDVRGIEYGAVMKNIYALTSGIAKGLGYGDNYQAAFVCKSIEEISRFLHTALPEDRSVTDLPYLGDLLVTAYSQFSRNRIFGLMLGKGYSVKAARFEMKMVAEGYFSTAVIHRIAGEKGIEMPILRATYDILYNNASPAITIKLISEQFNTY